VPNFMRIRQQAVQSLTLGHSRTWFPHTAFVLLDVQVLRCTNVHSTCHCPMPPDPADKAHRPRSSAHGQLLQIMGSVQLPAEQVHSSLYLKTTTLTKLCPTAKWAVGRPKCCEVSRNKRICWNSGNCCLLKTGQAW
jgi:hypothetical protein